MSVQNELVAGPELDRRVCGLLGIGPVPTQRYRDELPGRFCEYVDSWPAVSTDPAQAIPLAIAIRRKFGSLVLVFADGYVIARSCNEREVSTDVLLALCGLALKLAEGGAK